LKNYINTREINRYDWISIEEDEYEAHVQDGLASACSEVRWQNQGNNWWFCHISEQANNYLRSVRKVVWVFPQPISMYQRRLLVRYKEEV